MRRLVFSIGCAFVCCGLTACGRHTHENLHATLWMQTAGEYDAICHQAFQQAKVQLQAALSNPDWTAAQEQKATGGYQSKRPAIICDVDETLLDNSPYQAQLVRDDAFYTSASWRAWVDEEAAEPLPGALEFIRYAKSRGVETIYVTNRKADEEPATRRNLKAVGFPVSDDPDAVLTKGTDNGVDWESNKKERRKLVAKHYRILLLLGDDMNDFVDGTKVADPKVRREIAAQYGENWGRKWIVLPNPTYGSWEAATINKDYQQSDAAKLRLKYQKLRGFRED